MKTTNKAPNRPTHAVWNVIGDDNKAFWSKVGAAWPNRDGEGFNLIFDSFPISGKVVIRKIADKPASAV